MKIDNAQRFLFDSGVDALVPVKDKNNVQHFELACKSILNYCDTYRMPDTYTINPYRGCEFGCRYCYARYTHEFMDLAWEEFERKIFVKITAADVLLRSLDFKKVRDKHIAIGTVTDPYQPAEAKFRLTQRLLEVFAQAHGLSLSITTKSALVQRDIPLFRKIAEKNDFQINISLISLDEKLLRRLEPKASVPAARLAALKRITGNGLRAGIFMMPVLPGITDSRQNMESVIRAAHESGAHYVHGNVLFLKESSKQIFYEFLRRTEPQLYRKYPEIYRDRSYTPQRYQEKVTALITALKAKYGFSVGPRQKAALQEAQTSLWG